MKRILVTGGSGFIGTNFIYYLLGIDDQVTIVNYDKLTYAGNPTNLQTLQGNARYSFVQADICDGEALASVFAKFSIDTVIHFAAESHVDRSITGPRIFIETNVVGTSILLEAARKAWEIEGGWRDGVKYLQISTDEVYGSLGSTGFFTEETPLDPHSPYSASKAAADLLVKAYHDTYGMPVNITRCSNNYGPYQFLEKLIPLMINNCLSHRPLPVYGDGLQVRDWLYVDDHCKAIEMVARKGKNGEVYNVGGHNERTNLAIVQTIIDYVNRHIDPRVDESLIQHVEDRKGHDRRYGIDPEKIKRELGWYPETSFEEGIIKTIRWYLDSGEWVENVVSGEYRNYYKDQYGE